MALTPIREKVWPWSTPILVREQGEVCTQVHVFDQWCWLGTANNEDDLESILQTRHQPCELELDTYKILVKHLFGTLPAGLQIQTTDAKKRLQDIESTNT